MTEEERVENCFAAALPLMPFSGADLASKNRWGSTRRNLGKTAGSLMVCGLLDRTVFATYPDWESGFVLEESEDDEDGQDEEEKEKNAKTAQKKVWRMKCCLRTPAGRRSLCLVLFICEPPDALFLKLQKADEQGDLLLQCCHKASSPFTACSLQYGKMLRESPIEGVLGGDVRRQS